MAASLTNNAVVSYIKESKEELKKVAWPSRRTIIVHTLVVIGLSIALAVFFAALDFGLTYGVEQLLTR